MMPTTSAKRRRWLLSGFAVLLLAGAASAWWWLHRPMTALLDPPMPPDIQDAEVRQAIEHARRKVLDNPRSGDAWGRLGMTLLAQLFDRDADRCFTQAAQLDPTDPRWPYGRGQIALKRDPDHALPFLRQAAAAAGPEQQSNYRLALAEALLERQDLEEAERLLQEEWKRKPGDPRTALGLGLIAGQRGDAPAATDYLTAASSSPFARKMATAQLATLARRGGDKATAEEYEKATAALPDDPPWPDLFLDQVIQLRVGQRRREREVDELEKQHRYAEAAELYLTQLKEKPTATAYDGAGINLSRLGDYEQALPLLREGVRLEPDSAKTHYTLALVLFSHTEKHWKQAPNSPEAKKSFQEVVRHARRATELKADHAQAYLFWGLALKYLGQPDKAVAPLRQGVACRPDSFELQLALGEALRETGHYPKAETHLENAHRLDAKDPRPVEALQRLRQKKN